MTDILAYLASRSLRGRPGPAANDGASMLLLRPRLPYRHEIDLAAPRAMVEAGEHEMPTVAPAPTARSAGEFAPGIAEAHPAPASPSPRLPAARSPSPPEPPRATPAGSTETQISAGPVRPAAMPAVGDDSPAMPPAPVRQTRPAMRRVSPAEASAPRQAAAGMPAPTRREARRGTPEEPARQAAHALPAAPRPDMAEPSPASPARTVVVRPVLAVQPRAAPGASRVRARDPAEAPFAMPPRVQVTIGRLEIRAATAPPPPPSRKRPSPAMSLDEYLGGRARG